MEGLMNMYNRFHPMVPGLGFNNKHDSISFTTVTHDPRDERVNTTHRKSASREELEVSLRQCPLTRKVAACLVNVPVTKGMNPYYLEIAEEDYKHVLNRLGIWQPAVCAYSSDLTFDLVPWTEDGEIRGFYASIFMKRLFGLYMVYDERDDSSRGICWGGQNVLPGFIDALVALQSVALQPGYFLLCAAGALNLHLSRRLPLMAADVAAVEKRTGYQGWDMTAHPTAEGSLPELSARMSGDATSMAAGQRVSKVSKEILSAIEGHGSLIDGNVPLHPGPSRVIFQIHYATIKRRIKLQDIYIDFILARIQTQLTAVSIKLSWKLSFELTADSCLI